MSGHVTISRYGIPIAQPDNDSRIAASEVPLPVPMVTTTPLLTDERPRATMVRNGLMGTASSALPRGFTAGATSKGTKHAMDAATSRKGRDSRPESAAARYLKVPATAKSVHCDRVVVR